MALVDRKNPRGPLAQQALRYAVRRTTKQKDRFADQGGLQKNEMPAFRRTVERRTNRLMDKKLPPQSKLYQLYDDRLSFLRLPEGRQKKIIADRRERRDLRQYLAGDEVYNEQRDMLKRALQDYLLSNQDQRGRVREDFGVATERLGEERTLGQQQMLEDFASRGMLQSGAFAKDMGLYDKKYTQSLGDLTRSKDRSIDDLREQMRLFRSESQMRLQAARQDAIRRRAAQEGIGLSAPAKRRKRRKK